MEDAEPEQALQAGLEFGEAQSRQRVASRSKQRLGRVGQRGIVEVMVRKSG